MIKIPSEVTEYLNTKKGRKRFGEIEGCTSKSMLYDRIDAFVKPPKNVSRWVRTMEILKSELNIKK